MGGYAISYHCSELPFAFNNIELYETSKGDNESVEALADKVSRTWIYFARIGNTGGKHTRSDNDI